MKSGLVLSLILWTQKGISGNTYLPILDCIFNNDINILKISIVEDGPSANVSDTLDAAMWIYHNHFNVPVIFGKYNLDYEMPSLYITDLFSWQGRRFNLRPNQESMALAFREEQWDIQWKKLRKNFGLVIFCETVLALDKYLTGAARPPFYSPRGRYVIIFMEPLTESSRSSLEMLLRRMWVDYALLMAFAFSAANQSEIFYFYPFVRINTHLKSQEDAYNISNWGRVETATELDEELCSRSFESYPKNFNEYPIRTVLFQRDPTASLWTWFPNSFLNTRFGKLRKFSPEIGGTDGIQFASVVQALNMTPILFDITSNNPYPYYNSSNLLTNSGEVIYSRYDIAMNYHFMLGNTLSYEYLQPFTQDQYCIVVPKAAARPIFNATFRNISRAIWVLIIALPIFLGCMWKALEGISFKKGKDPLPIVLKIGILYLLILNLPIKFKLRTNFEKFLIFSVIMCSFVFSSIFSGVLVRNFTKVSYFQEISTLEDLAKTDLKILTNSHVILDILFGKGTVDNDVIKALKGKMVEGGKADNIEEVAAVNVNVCKISMQTDFEIWEEIYKKKYGMDRFHKVEECPRSFFSSYIVRKGFPLSERFNSVLSSFISAGLINYWYNVTKFEMGLRTEIDNLDKRRASHTHSLSMLDLWPFFVALLFGNIVGGLVFWLEVGSTNGESEKKKFVAQ